MLSRVQVEILDGSRVVTWAVVEWVAAFRGVT